MKCSLPDTINTSSLKFTPLIKKPDSLIGEEFTFLNKSKHFPNLNINWNEDQFGLLWVYNLNYFDYLLQKHISASKGLKLIESFIDSYQNNIIGSQPYPISLRGINWIKFLSLWNINSNDINHHLLCQFSYLSKNLEYHILGNHLLENAFSLLFAAYYFEHLPFYKKSKKLLYDELEEQILSDGAHFELSPMYHMIILERLLDSINLIQNNSIFDDKPFFDFLISKSKIMLSWLSQIVLQNNDTPHFNDSAPDISATNSQLFKYADRLNINFKKVPLSQSGYRKHITQKYEIAIDIGNIGPEYQPGHAHCDTFNFHLNVHNSPFIVDTGTSTYETGELRQQERSTSAHNTVQYLNKEQSEIWNSFKVGNRANIIKILESPNSILALHNGYKKYGVIHEREFQFDETVITIHDKLKGTKDNSGYAFFHFYPSIQPVKKGSKILTDECEISFTNSKNIEIYDYNLSIGFNRTFPSKVIKISFINYLTTDIRIV